MKLADLIDNHARFLREGGLEWLQSARAPEPGDRAPLLIISNGSPAMTGLLENILDLKPGQAVLLRLAGAWGGPHAEDLLRSVSLALKVHGCRDIVVIETSDNPIYGISMRTRRKILEQAGLEPGTSAHEQVQAHLQVPSSPEDAAVQTARALRDSGLLPERVSVHACLLDRKSGDFKVLVGEAVREVAPVVDAAPKHQPAQAADIPLPELPDIPLPEIPELDLDHLTSAAPARKRKFEYGRKQENAGPVSLFDFKQMAQDQVPLPPSVWDAPPLPLPESAAPFLPESTERQPPAVPGKPGQHKKRHPAQEGQEQPMVTPIANGDFPQLPLGERVLDFESDEKTPLPVSRVTVDLAGGYLAENGTEYPLNPDLQKALIKVASFMGREFNRVDRHQIMGRIRRLAMSGAETGELVKVLVNPILKLGKKRYAVLNELLKIKEELPQHSNEVATVILESTFDLSDGGA